MDGAGLLHHPQVGAEGVGDKLHRRPPGRRRDAVTDDHWHTRQPRLPGGDEPPMAVVQYDLAVLVVPQERNEDAVPGDAPGKSGELRVFRDISHLGLHHDRGDRDIAEHAGHGCLRRGG